MATPLDSRKCHMSVDDSAEEFIWIHALGRERLLLLSCGILPHPPEILFLPVGRPQRVFFSFLHTSRQSVLLSRHEKIWV